jgi:hypothetical protein
MKERPHEICTSEVIIGEIVDDDVIGLDALGDLLVRAAPWSAQPVALQPLVTVFLWFLMSADLAVGAWLFSVLRAQRGCDERLCALATLSGHPGLTLGLAVGSFVVLLAVVAVALIAVVIAVLGAVMSR